MRAIALPVLRCDWCGDEYVVWLDLARRCPVCARHGAVAAERRREANREYWREWSARKSEERGV
ncbi:MAG: hypothetical protein IRZ07_03880 [Microbispora sp.]|nr:hypothetical protein [Microbispora sp.]